MATRTINYEYCHIYFNYGIFSIKDLETVKLVLQYFDSNFKNIYPKYYNLKHIDKYLNKKNLLSV